MGLKVWNILVCPKLLKLKLPYQMKIEIFFTIVLSTILLVVSFNAFLNFSLSVNKRTIFSHIDSNEFSEMDLIELSIENLMNTFTFKLEEYLYLISQFYINSGKDLSAVKIFSKKIISNIEVIPASFNLNHKNDETTVFEDLQNTIRNAPKYLYFLKQNSINIDKTNLVDNTKEFEMKNVNWATFINDFILENMIDNKNKVNKISNYLLNNITYKNDFPVYVETNEYFINTTTQKNPKFTIFSPVLKQDSDYYNDNNITANDIIGVFILLIDKSLDECFEDYFLWLNPGLTYFKFPNYLSEIQPQSSCAFGYTLGEDIGTCLKVSENNDCPYYKKYYNYNESNPLKLTATECYKDIFKKYFGNLDPDYSTSIKYFLTNFSNIENTENLYLNENLNFNILLNSNSRFKILKTIYPISAFSIINYFFPLSKLEHAFLIKNQGFNSLIKETVNWNLNLKKIKIFSVILIIIFLFFVKLFFDFYSFSKNIELHVNSVKNAVNIQKNNEETNDIIISERDVEITEFKSLTEIIKGMIKGDINLKQNYNKKDINKMKLDNEEYNKEFIQIKMHNIFVNDDKIEKLIEDNNYSSKIIKESEKEYSDDDYKSSQLFIDARLQCKNDKKTENKKLSQNFDNDSENFVDFLSSIKDSLNDIGNKSEEIEKILEYYNLPYVEYRSNNKDLY